MDKFNTIPLVSCHGKDSFFFINHPNCFICERQSDLFNACIFHKSSKASVSIMIFIILYHSNEKIVIDENNVPVVSSVKLLGVQLDDKLNFNLHISSICKSAANQLNAMIRLKSYLSFDAKKVLINSYFSSNFNYCPLVWMFSTSNSLNKIENLQKRALRFLYNEYSLRAAIS